MLHRNLFQAFLAKLNPDPEVALDTVASLPVIQQAMAEVATRTALRRKAARTQLDSHDERWAPRLNAAAAETARALTETERAAEALRLSNLKLQAASSAQTAAGYAAETERSRLEQELKQTADQRLEFARQTLRAVISRVRAASPFGPVSFKWNMPDEERAAIRDLVADRDVHFQVLVQAEHDLMALQFQAIDQADVDRGLREVFETVNVALAGLQVGERLHLDDHGAVTLGRVGAEADAGQPAP